ncbi:MAG: PEP-CTERM sorting domain-containing protein [Verrucomicrobiota bacterium]
MQIPSVLVKSLVLAFLAIVALGSNAKAMMIYCGNYDDRDWYVDNSYPVYPDAIADAAAIGGTLATIRSYDEQLWVRQHVSNLPAWIGYHRSDSTASDWHWADGWSGGYTFWAPNNPATSTIADQSYVVAMMGSSGDGPWNVGGYPSTYGYVAIATVPTVPEPASLLLLAVGGGALLLRRSKP